MSDHYLRPAKRRAAPERCPSRSGTESRFASGGVGVLLAEVELLEARFATVGGEADACSGPVVEHERIAQSASRGESIGRRKSQTAERSRCWPPGSASRSLRAMRSEPSALVRVTLSGSSTKADSSGPPARRSRAAGRDPPMPAGAAAAIASAWRGSWRPVSPTGCWRSRSLQPARRRSARAGGGRAGGRRSPSAPAAGRRWGRPGGAQVMAEAEVRARRLDLAGAGVGALRAVLLAAARSSGSSRRAPAK